MKKACCPKGDRRLSQKNFEQEVLATARQILERDILINADIAGQTQNALCNNVLQDFIRPTGNP
jgi:hypothetical protein